MNKKYQLYTASYNNSVLFIGISDFNENIQEYQDPESVKSDEKLLELINELDFDAVSNIQYQVVRSGLEFYQAVSEAMSLRQYYRRMFSTLFSMMKSSTRENLLLYNVVPSQKFNNCTFTTGLMGAGKSAKLIDQFNNSQIERQHSICFSITSEEQGLTGTLGRIESRNGNFLYSINLNIKEPTEMLVKTVTNLCKDKGIRNVYIDEVQFAPTELTDAFINMASTSNLQVNFYGLDKTFDDKIFPGSKVLIDKLPYENINRIYMTCQIPNCECLAVHNSRFTNGRIVTRGDVISEEKDQYMSICDHHYKEFIDELF